VEEERDVNIRVENVPGCSFLTPCPVCWRMTIGKGCGSGRITCRTPFVSSEAEGSECAHLVV
jgi:hypothetical protein